MCKDKKEQVKLCRAEMDLGPIWDARVDLTTLVGIMGAAIYLCRPDEPDTEKADVIVALVAVQEKLADLADGLDGAIKGMKILKEAAA